MLQFCCIMVLGLLFVDLFVELFILSLETTEHIDIFR